jgi:ATP/maltotriose-dependent transcriptional regulator MalT/DNA-binding SARP family transcriptional activator
MEKSNRKSLSIAKITRPALSGVLERKRLYRELDRGRRCPAIWVSSPAGSGKTTLVNSYLKSRGLPSIWYQVDEGDSDIATFFYYMGLAEKKANPRKRKPLPLLTPEYMMGIPTFTRRYFEELFSRLKSPYLVVLDNYHEVPEESPFHEMIQTGLSVVPEGISVVLVSRTEAPGAFARLRANEMMSTLGWEEIRLTLGETSSLLRLRRKPKELAQYLHETTDGWAAGIVLLMEKAGKTEQKHLQGQSTKEVFDYFASEILEKSDEKTKDFLLKTSLLPFITPGMAESLTGMDDAGGILHRLSRDNFFTVRRPGSRQSYQYHPLFRAFLGERARGIFTGEDWEGLIRLIMGQARSLIMQGRNHVLGEWLKALPEEGFNNMPWLQYWMGMSVLPFSPHKGREHLERAFEMFDAQNDPMGVLLSWSGVVESFFRIWDNFIPLDRWIDWMDNRMKTERSFPSPEIESMVACSMVGALIYRRPEHPEIKKWIERTLELAERSENIDLRMQTYMNVTACYFWIGDYEMCDLTIEKTRRLAQSPNASPLSVLISKHLYVAYRWVKAESESSLRLVSEGLEFSASHGIHFFDHMFIAYGIVDCLSRGDIVKAEELLKKSESFPLNANRSFTSHYHFLKAWYYLLLDNIPEAFVHAEAAVGFVDEIGVPFTAIFGHVLIAWVSHKKGDRQKALDHLYLARDIAHKTKSAISEFIVLLTEAWFALDRREDTHAIECLGKAFALGREKGYVNYEGWLPSMMARLCHKALEEGIEVEYVQTLVRKRDLIPEVLPETENWPWAVRVYTLGGFDVIKERKPLRFSGRSKERPLALLKALIALGGKGIPEDRLTDALWPEADGDTAHQTFATNLHRLRNILGNENIVRINGGKVSIDPRYCWVDMWVFERALGRAGKDSKQATRELEKAVGIYRGHFLPSDEVQPWTAPMRERLRSKFLRGLKELGGSLEREGFFDKAVEYYQRGLDTDDQAEEIYRLLMACYLRLGRRAEGLSVYERCRVTLDRTLGVEPSPETLVIYRKLHSNE